MGLGAFVVLRPHEASFTRGICRDLAAGLKFAISVLFFLKEWSR